MFKVGIPSQAPSPHTFRETEGRGSPSNHIEALTEWTFERDRRASQTLAGVFAVTVTQQESSKLADARVVNNSLP